ncbi:MAG: nitroreductase [Candidatus Omnitrophica bacterium 4484_171]|nr:MAG: nitroreductase [Candidatus Omnitrophica bacterium 4484_171]
MDIFEAIKKRKSIRGYKHKEVEEDKIKKIMDFARLAPSASNRQEWRFIVVKDKDKRKALSKAAKNQSFVEEAPVVIACCAETDNHVMACGQLCYPIDVAIAIDHIALCAVSLGLGTCWVGAFYEDEAKMILSVPEEIRIVELIALGYPEDGTVSLKERLPLEDIVFKEDWGKAYYK